jgi:tetratricopeptide (TPR) repeat protein
LGRYDEALADFGQALQLNPDYALAYLNRGNVYQNLDQAERAQQDFNRAFSLDPNHPAMQAKLEELTKNYLPPSVFQGPR